MASPHGLLQLVKRTTDRSLVPSNGNSSLMSQSDHFRPSSAVFARRPLPLRLKSGHSAVADSDADFMPHHATREHGANGKAVGEPDLISTAHHCGDGVWAAAGRLVRDQQQRIWQIAAALLERRPLTGDEIGVMIAANA
jgi:hypothetical protein